MLFAGQDDARRDSSPTASPPPRPRPPRSKPSPPRSTRSRDSFTDDRRDLGARLAVLIAANTELQERSVYKSTVLAAAMAQGLRKRDVPERTANLAAEIGMAAFNEAFTHWADPADRRALRNTRERRSTGCGRRSRSWAEAGCRGRF